MARAPQDKQWQIDGDPFVIDNDEELGQALGEAMAILTRVGGSITIAPIRQELAAGVWMPTGYLFKWTSFFPGIRLQEGEAGGTESAPETVEVAA